MSSITWNYVKTLHDSSAVRDFLKNCHLTLPAGLLECLEKNNGGRPSVKLFDTDQSRECVFKALLSYNKDDRETIYMVYPDLFKNTSLFPVGTDSAGNFICYDFSSEEYVLWNQEMNRIERLRRNLND